MNLRPIQLWWKHNGADINLGVGYLDNIPAQGTLLTYPCEHGVGWRVVAVQQIIVQPGSMDHRGWVDRREYEPGPVDLFVEPAGGPFEP